MCERTGVLERRNTKIIWVVQTAVMRRRGRLHLAVISFPELDILKLQMRRRELRGRDGKVVQIEWPASQSLRLTSKVRSGLCNYRGRKSNPFPV
jgi:hypothetical protein